MSDLFIPTTARTYDLAVEPRRQQWNAYLSANHLAPRRSWPTRRIPMRGAGH